MSPGAMLVAILLLAVIGAAVAAITQGRKKPHALPAPTERMGMRSIAGDGNALALAEVEGRRRRRAAAREIVAQDPAAARELGIGRPDLRRGYDDGGLVDLNSAPGDVLVAELGITQAQADAILVARARMGRFDAPEDLHLVDAVDPATYDRIVDRVVLL